MKTLSFIKTIAKDAAKLLVIDYETFFGNGDKESEARLTQILGKLAVRPDLQVVLVCEHDNKDLRILSQYPNLQIITEYGAIIRRSGQEHQHIEADTSWKSQMFPVLIEYSLRSNGTYVEENPFSLCWNFKDASDKKMRKIVPELLEELGWYQSKFNLRILQRKQMVEILPNNIDKGIATLRLLQEKKFDYAIALAADNEGENIFKALMPFDNCITVKVGEGYSFAKHSVPDTHEALYFLENI